MKKRITAAMLAAVMLFLCAFVSAGCGSDEDSFLTSCDDSANFPVTINAVRIEERPKRVVCTSSKHTDIAIELGYAKYIVGKPYEYAASAVSDASEVGTNDNPSLEIIAGLEADLVIVDEMIPEESLTALVDSGVPVLQLGTPRDRMSFRNTYSCIGAALGGARDGQNAAIKKAESILISLDDIERLVSSEPTSYVCIFTNSGLSSYITGDDITTMCIELAGGFNVAIEGKNGVFSLDQVSRGDPDVILCPAGSQPTVRSKRVLNSCSAVTGNRIYDFDVSKFNCCDSQLIVATWELARLLHPNIVTKEMLPKGAIDYYVYTSSVMTQEEYDALQSQLAEAEAEQTYVFVYED
ncbi:MAG: ABC transporter substrate-binding protein [Clostridia bacterium]|nr:ABC transporter substrate-binding protein [Clostridia bacterium]